MRFPFLVINSNLGPILPRFRDIAGFRRKATPLLFHPNFMGVPVFPLDYIADVVAPRSEDPKLIILVINFELVQPICSAYINVTDGRTDRRTDGQMTYDSNTALALRASRGNKSFCFRPVAYLQVATHNSNFYPLPKRIVTCGLLLQFQVGLPTELLTQLTV